uniref:ATP synthase complex subunit 8 n=1 Tax=Japyx solifugus TaxID=296598 RepID=Q4G302_JAPSO|nr:ATP synthase F0 subunit 8 [Japyx solifugus]AAV33412.1 ATP synthase F0 subunit 8 [Japyx solifugus]
MPQMSPMPWLIMFIMISLALIMFMTMNFFIKSNMPTTSHISTTTKTLNWKW